MDVSGMGELPGRPLAVIRVLNSVSDVITVLFTTIRGVHPAILSRFWIGFDEGAR